MGDCLGTLSATDKGPNSRAAKRQVVFNSSPYLTLLVSVSSPKRYSPSPLGPYSTLSNTRSFPDRLHRDVPAVVPEDQDPASRERRRRRHRHRDALPRPQLHLQRRR